MAADLTSADYSFLILLKAEGRELSNTEMDKIYRVRLISPAYEKLNAAGYVESDTTRRPYRHAITTEGAKVLGVPLVIDSDQAEEGDKRSTREKQLWAALVALQNQTLRLPAAPAPDPAPASAPDPDPAPASAAEHSAPPAAQNGATTSSQDLGGRIRAAYAQLAAPGTWVALTAIRPLFTDVPKSELDRALVRLLAAPDVRLEPEPFGHRIGAQERQAAVHIGGEDRHKLAIGLR